jgi:hypothetical protein
MKQTSGPAKEPADKIVKENRRATRKHCSAEEKILIVLEGLRGEDSIAKLYRRKRIALLSCRARWRSGGCFRRCISSPDDHPVS